MRQLRGDVDEYPLPGHGTTQADLEETLWVLQCANQTNPKATTWVDLELHHSGIHPDTIGVDNVDIDD